MRFFRSKWFIAFLITIFILIIMGIWVNKNNRVSWLNNIISVPLTPVQAFFFSIGKSIDNNLFFLNNINAMKKEINALRVRVNELEKENRELSYLKDKNEELKLALNLKTQFDNYEVKGANIVAIDPSNWRTIFKIDIGIKDGIEVDCPVVTESGELVGKIISADLTSSNVLTVIDEDSTVAGWISKSRVHVRVRGDMPLKKQQQGRCIMDFIPLDVNVTVGDVIETSNYSTIYPKGILIGKVIEINEVNSKMNRYAIIDPAADFERLEEVYVLTSKIKNTKTDKGSR